MTSLPLVEIGFVSKDLTQRDFLATVFDLELLDPVDLPYGVLHRLRGYGTVLKVLIPQEEPVPPTRAVEFHAATGIRFITIRVTDLDAVVARVEGAGGRVTVGPVEPMPGVRLAMIEDPDGNLIEASQLPQSE